MPEIDPESLKQLKAEVEKIPPQACSRAEASRLALKRAVERLEKENQTTCADTDTCRGSANREMTNSLGLASTRSARS